MRTSFPKSPGGRHSSLMSLGHEKVSILPGDRVLLLKPEKAGLQGQFPAVAPGSQHRGDQPWSSGDRADPHPMVSWSRMS